MVIASLIVLSITAFAYNLGDKKVFSIFLIILIISFFGLVKYKAEN